MNAILRYRTNTTIFSAPIFWSHLEIFFSSSKLAKKLISIKSTAKGCMPKQCFLKTKFQAGQDMAMTAPALILLK